MILTIPIELYEEEYVIFMDKKNNIVLNDGYFTKIYYSNNSITLNGLYILFNYLNTIENNNIYDNNVKYINNLINSIQNSNTYNRLHNIEKNMLNNYNEYFQLNKKPIYTIKNIFYKNNYKKIKYIIKISGIWENNDEIGLAYKIEKI